MLGKILLTALKIPPTTKTIQVRRNIMNDTRRSAIMQLAEQPAKLAFKTRQNRLRISQLRISYGPTYCWFQKLNHKRMNGDSCSGALFVRSSTLGRK